MEEKWVEGVFKGKKRFPTEGSGQQVEMRSAISPPDRVPKQEIGSREQVRIRQKELKSNRSARRDDLQRKRR